MENKKKNNVLGRGLSALLTEDKSDSKSVGAASIANQAGVVIYIPLTQIEVNPFQPRTTFEVESLQDLSDSIRIHGVIQPITVRKIENNKYQLIAGERRLRATKLAGKTEIPAYVRAASDQESIEIALIENIQREDLNALEEAQGVQRLISDFGYTHEKAALALGRSRSATRPQIVPAQRRVPCASSRSRP